MTNSNANAALQQLLNAPKIDIEGKSCFNCNHCKAIPGDRDTGFETEAMCEFEPQADQNIPPDWYDLLLDHLQPNDDEDTIGQACPFYSPILVELCWQCKKPINSVEHLHKIFSPHPEGDPIPVCSEACKKDLDKKISKEQEDEKKALERLEKDRQQAFLDDTYEMTPQDYRDSDFAYDVYREGRGNSYRSRSPY
jgi:hypothetical protein